MIWRFPFSQVTDRPSLEQSPVQTRNYASSIEKNCKFPSLSINPDYVLCLVHHVVFVALRHWINPNEVLPLYAH
jgi:hypothetical protein